MKKDKKIPMTKKVDQGRETRVLLEEIRHEVKTVAEGHSTVISKLEELDAQLQRNEAEHFKLEMIAQSVKSQTGTIDTKVDRIERELETVKNALLDMSSVTKGYDARITKLEEKVLT